MPAIMETTMRSPTNGTSPAPGGQIIEISGLTKRYKNGVLANDAIDLTVGPGVIFGLLGPNGSGKTTLVRQLIGELLPTGGSVQVHGIDVLREPTRAKALMGVVPQESGTFDMLKADEHLRVFGRLQGLSLKVARERTEQLLQTLDLAPHRHKLSWHLSGGLKRKLLMGMAIISHPPILVLDEPTTGLDPNSRREVWALIENRRAEGATVLLTTHYMEEAEALCDQVAILGLGRVLAKGSVDNIRSLCRNQFKATFQVNGTARTVLGKTHADVAQEVEAMGIPEYSLTKTSLEDLYLELTARTKGQEAV
jgi:ABC-2 type transport system ATP-binding protein